MQPLIKWTGSKRSQAKKIISYFPKNISCYFEPFLGSGAVLGVLSPQKATCGDISDPLIKLWVMVQSDPGLIYQEYKKRWNNLQKYGYKYYYKVREQFNKNKSPHDFLFLSRTCVNGLIRFNRKGEFNNSLHHSRKGMNPERLKKILYQWHPVIKDYQFFKKDYVALTRLARKGDLVYLDPPYFNTKNSYEEQIDFNKFIDYLKDLNKRGIKFVLSFDGTRGNKEFFADIPKTIYKRHVLINSGLSPFNKVQNKKIEQVFESLYLNY